MRTRDTGRTLLLTLAPDEMENTGQARGMLSASFFSEHNTSRYTGPLSIYYKSFGPKIGLFSACLGIVKNNFILSAVSFVMRNA